MDGRPAGRLARALGRRPRTVLGLAAGLVVLSIWTSWFGPAELNVGGVRLFRNSSTWRPLVGAGLLLLAGRHVSLLFQTVAAALLISALPWRAYMLHLQIASTPSRPLSTLAQCVAEEGRPGVYVVEPHGISHSYFYNLRHAGPWTTSGEDLDETRRRLLSNDARDQTPVLMTRGTWRDYRLALDLPPMPTAGEPSRNPFDNGLQFGNDDVLLVPPRFSRCLEAAIERGNGDRLAPDDPAGDPRP